MPKIQPATRAMATVPRPTVQRKRLIFGIAIRRFQLREKPSGSRAPRRAWRGSCFHSEVMLSTATTTAAPCTTCTSRVGLNSISTKPSSALPTIMPTSSVL